MISLFISITTCDNLITKSSYSNVKIQSQDYMLLPFFEGPKCDPLYIDGTTLKDSFWVFVYYNSLSNFFITRVRLNTSVYISKTNTITDFSIHGWNLLLKRISLLIFIKGNMRRELDKLNEIIIILHHNPTFLMNANELILLFETNLIWKELFYF